jgi:hypothetical protein
MPPYEMAVFLLNSHILILIQMSSQQCFRRRCLIQHDRPCFSQCLPDPRERAVELSRSMQLDVRIPGDPIKPHIQCAERDTPIIDQSRTLS